MLVRFGLVVLLAVALVRAQSAKIWIDVAQAEDDFDVENSYTNELMEDLQTVKDAALLLYTEYCAKTAIERDLFLKNISSLSNDTIAGLATGMFENSSESCRQIFENRLKKIEYDAHKAASFSTETHHKFLLGHMIVFRMHLNKSEEYIKKCDRVIQDCGISCEKMPRVTRWRRHAADELSRVRDDLEHSRRSYRDLVIHVHRKLNHLRRHATAKVRDAVEQFRLCNLKV